MVRAGFNADQHNARLLARHLCEGHSETFEEYQRSISLATAPTKDYAAVLGEVIVHSQDIAQPMTPP